MPSRSEEVGTAATTLLSYNPKRTSVSIFNEDSVSIFIGEDEADLLTEGSPVTAGGAISLVAALGDTPDRVMFAISAAGGADVRILEQFGKLPLLEEPPVRASVTEAGI